jgi:hypothetical protein
MANTPDQSKPATTTSAAPLTPTTQTPDIATKKAERPAGMTRAEMLADAQKAANEQIKLQQEQRSADAVPNAADETIPGGLYIVGGRVVDADGVEVKS